MGCRDRSPRKVHVLSPLLAAVGLAAGTMAFAGPSAAEVSAVGGGAFGASVDVSSSGAAPTVAAPTPSVTLPSSGGDVSDDAPSVLVGDDAGLLETGALTVASQGATGAEGTATGSASVATVDALDATLTAAEVASTCTADDAGTTATATATDGSLVVSATETVPLPSAPAPNTVIEGTVASGDAFTVTLNEQAVVDGTMTVTAVRLVLAGPTAVGEIVLAQSSCATTAAATPPPAEEAPVTVEPTIAPPVASGDAVAPAETRTAAAATTALPGPEFAAAAAGPTAAATAGAAAAAQVAAVCTVAAPGAYGFCASVSLFGGPAMPAGPDPTAVLPAGGSATPVTDSAGTGRAQFGPGIIFTSNALEVSTSGTPGQGDGVTSTANIRNVNTSDQEVFTASAVASTCTGGSGSTTITGGTLRTSEGANLDSEADDTVVPVPANPAPNTRIAGQIETVQDNYEYIFNEQIRNDDGSITINAAHLRLLGPTAIGDLIIGQVRCGAGAPGGPTDPGGTTDPGTTGRGDAGAGGAATGRGAGSGRGAGGAGAGGAGAGAPGRLPTTGGDVLPMLLVALGLVAAGSTTVRWAAGPLRLIGVTPGSSTPRRRRVPAHARAHPSRHRHDHRRRSGLI